MAPRRVPESAALPTPDMRRLHDSRVVIEHVTPQLDGGRYPIKREVGSILEVQADIFRDGHDLLTAALLYRSWDEQSWSEAAMECLNPGLDRWRGSFELSRVTTYVYTIQAWTNTFGTWLMELQKKFGAGQDVASELQEGIQLIREAAARAAGADQQALLQAAEYLNSRSSQADAVRNAAAESLARLMARYPDRSQATWAEREYEVMVDRQAAHFAAWYELFPRSQAPAAENRPGTFRDCIARLPDLAAMGFDVLYLPPIHPIGRTHRKGKNNALSAGPDDPGSPWAIGNEQGGHDAIEPGLGTLADFRALVAAARGQGMEVALDFAIQCSPDHPYVREHPEWFSRRPDGTIKYAENPPKKYQDIYPLNFSCAAWASLWEEMRRVVLFWVDQGVKTFRVDNPHTKPVRFWEWLIREVRRVDPEVLFLAEAFTRPRMMQALAKSGFNQSYTYFTWRNGKQELIDYLRELTQSEMAEYYRGNFFVNTPDILHAYLQHGGPPAFRVRLVLAATLSSVYGIYSGFELCENTPLHAGSEEYLNSEKYEIRPRDWNAAGNIKDLITLVNRARRQNPALQLYRNLAFHNSDNDQILCYSKATPDFNNRVLVVVNLDPQAAQESWVHLDLAALGLGADAGYRVEDLLTGSTYEWHGAHNWVRLDPGRQPAHVFVLHGG